MQVKSVALGMMLMVGLLLGNLAGPGLAAQGDTRETVLPRSFQGARLGMTLSELTRIVPDAKGVSLNRRDPAQRIIVLPSKDHAVQRVEYRFYNDRLRELAIHYNYDAVPGGFKELRQRLQEAYGEPAVAEQTDYDAGPNIASVKKTVWKDGSTMSVLAQFHKLDQGREFYDLILTITDRELQQIFEQDQEQYRRQETLRVPIPLPTPGIQSKQMAMSRLERTHM
ncbi:MAG: hypothetical protein H8K03_11720 [Nitrospira sp.]|jgi:hypothetical protein|nr:hypothetical protein [Nitrospira sp. BO4]